MTLVGFINRPRKVGASVLGAFSLGGPLVGIHTLLSGDSSSLLFVIIGTAFPPVVTAVFVWYVYRYYDDRSGDTLLTTTSVATILLGMVFALTAISIIWGQRTFGVTMADPLILVTEMVYGGALFGLIYGHYYGLSLIRRRRLQEKTVRLQQQNERLEEFTSIVSHDLRNPLSIADGYLQLAREGETIDGSHVETAQAAIKRSQRLVTELLELARQGDDVGEVRPVELDGVAESCWAGIDNEAGTLSVEVERPIIADPTRLQQLLQNLFENAVRHNDRDVEVTVGPLDDGFYVADDGVGLSEVAAERLFEPGHSGKPEGTGFGLSIVKRIVEAHGWNITATTSAEGGAQFEIRHVEFA